MATVETIHVLRTDTLAAAVGRFSTLARSLDRKAIGLILAWKLATFALIVIGYFTFTFFEEQRQANSLSYPPQASPDFSTRFTTWDSSHYLYLAEHGYHQGQPSNWFLPLYPLTIHAMKSVTGNGIVAGLLVSNVASFAGLYLFFHLVSRKYGARAGIRALALLISFPAAFFLNLVYSEGLFLLLSVGFFFFLYERKLWPAAACAFLLPLLRFVGALVVLPLFVFLVTDTMSSQVLSFRRALVALLRDERSLALLAPVAGIAAYFGFMTIATGTPFAARDAAGLFDSGWDVTNIVKPWVFVHNFGGIPIALHGELNSSLDRLFFVGFFALLPLVYRKVDKVLFAWCLCMGLQPLLGSFMSYMRYVMLAVPVYIAIARAYVDRSDFSFRLVLYPMAALQLAFVVLHSADYWVA